MARIHSLFLAIVLFALCFGLISAQAETQLPSSVSIRASATDNQNPNTTNAPSKPSQSASDDDEENQTDTAAKPQLTPSKGSSNDESSISPSSNSTESSTASASSTTPATSSSTSSAPTADPTSGGVRTTDDWYKPEEEKLPLQPRVTPAFGFGGALLIITGTIFAFVGIQHRLIFIFLSTVYLVCLSVTVLILYVINPPITDAIQGAYLVGIIAPGLIFGGGAMVFSNLTEGFGCLLGGFCLSMWLLCLKPGGLLTNSTSITIFICIFCATVWSTAYIKFFMPYSLIFSLAISGATAMILGIDCFSRAGLKEFWVYIWRLNDDIFPLNTNSYPMTRGIKVEVAGIVVFTVLGILVQWKLWGFIKKKQRERREERERERRTLEREEEMIGRRVNWETTKQRERWEEVYEQERLKSGADVRQLSLGSDTEVGDASTKRVDSNSTLYAGKKGLPHITVREEAIEMSRLPNPSRDSSGAGSLGERISKITYTSTGADDEVEIVNAPEKNARKSRDIDALAALEGDRTSSRNPQRDSNTRSKRVSGSPDTPFPTLDVAADTHRADRLSADSRGSRLLHRLSHNSSTDKRRSTSKQGLREGDDEDWDRTSSIAATIDDLGSDVDFEDLRSLPSGTPRASVVLDKAILASDPDPGLAAKDKALDGNGDASDWTSALPSTGKGKASVADILHMAGPSKSLTKDALPAAAPRVATTYRTEEWTKRLELADAPAVPEFTPSPSATPTKATFPPSPTSPTSPTPPVAQTIPEDAVLDPAAPSTTDEAPRPLNVEALQQTAVTGAVAPAPTRPRSAQALSHSQPRRDQNPYRASMQPSASSHGAASRPSTGLGQNANIGVTRRSSHTSLALPKGQQRRASSTPLQLQVLKERDDDSMSLRERQLILRQSSMPLAAHIPAVASPSPAASPFRMSASHQLQPTRRQSAPRMPSSTSTPGYGNPHSLFLTNRGVPRPQDAELEVMELRRLEMLEERRLAGVRREEERRKGERRDGDWGERWRESVRSGRGEEVQRGGLRRLMGEGGGGG